MRDSLLPGAGPGGNKAVIVLLVAGIAILIAAGMIYFNRRSAKGVPDPTRVEDKIDIPAPLIASVQDRPIIDYPVQDASPESESFTDSDSKNKRVSRSVKMGTIDAKKVSSFMKNHFADVKACYERRLKNNNLLEGKLDVNIQVSTNGRVVAVTKNSDTVRDAEMYKCVKRTIRQWQFPKPTGGQVIIGKTFNFKKK